MSESHTVSVPTRSTYARRRSIVWALLLASSLLLTSSLQAQGSYRVYFKDGSSEATQGPYVVQGDKALLTLASGTETLMDLSEIDVEKTRSINAGFRSDAVMIDTSGTRPFDPNLTRGADQPTLQDVIRSKQGRSQDLTAEATRSDETNNVPKTLAGFADLQQFVRTSLEPTNLEAELNSSLRALGVQSFRLYQGTASDRLMVELTAESRFEVFQQLEALGKAFDVVVDSSEFELIEVLMLNSRRRRTGQFALSSENVAQLNAGDLTPSQFYLEHVQF